MVGKVGSENILREAKNGSELARERLILHYKPFVLNTVSHLCKRYMTWSDEESSIGLIAFNRAIDSFQPQGGRTFLNYVYLLIKRDLIDYFRREKHSQHLSLDHGLDEDNITLNHHETHKSIESYQINTQSSELVEEILELDKNLSQYNVLFEELEQYSPRHRDTRNQLLTMAAKFADDEECVDLFISKKRLPASLFARKTGCSLKTIERHRKYLITLILVKLNPQWVQLSGFIQGTPPIGKERLS